MKKCVSKNGQRRNSRIFKYSRTKLKKASPGLTHVGSHLARMLRLGNNFNNGNFKLRTILATVTFPLTALTARTSSWLINIEVKGYAKRLS